MTDGHSPEADDARVDKWLWAARFFKTRSLACAAIKGGKVEVNGERPKPSRHVQVGDHIRIRRGTDEVQIVVDAVTRQRGPASVASGLYSETPESHARRAELTAAARLLDQGAPRYAGRPDKRQRRQIIRFTKRRDDS